MQPTSITARGLHFHKLLIFLIPFLLCSCQAVSQITTPDELIKAHITALGGYDMYKSINLITSIGTYEEPRFKEVHRFDQKRPDLIRVTTRYNEETGSYGYAEGFDGAAWEYSAKVPVRVIGEPARALRNAAIFEPSYIDYKRKGYAAQYNGIVELKGFRLHHLKIIKPNDTVDNFFFDVKSLMNNINIGKAPFHGEGKEIEILTISSDYKPVGGVLIPHLIEQKSGKKVLSKLVWNKIEVNGKVADRWFSPPLSQEQEKFKAFRENMLAGNLSQMSGEYKDYQTLAHTQFRKKLENELNTFGYELMSHERYADAIEILKLAIENHPKSGNLHDSVAEAYLLHGDSTNSLKYYQMAFELNPQNSYAAEMILKLSGR